MSYIGFTSRGHDVHVSGAERAHLGHLTEQFGLSVLPDGEFEVNHPLPKLIVDLPDYLDQSINHARSRGERALAVRQVFSPFMGNRKIRFDGEDHPAIDLMANTALVLGETAALCCKIHFSCESHGFVEAEDREWFANLIVRALRSKVLRDGFWHDGKRGNANPGGESQWYSMGWDQLVLMLRNGEDSPVVMDYSVTDGVASYPPDSWQGVIGEPSDADDLDGDLQERISEAWYQLPWEERFDLFVEDLREHHPYRRIAPDTLQDQGFLSGKTIFDMLASDEWENARDRY